MICEAVAKQLPMLLYGELTFDDEEAIQQHLDLCSACRAELERTAALHQSLDRSEIQVESAVLADCRRDLRVATRALSEKGGPRRAFWSDLTAKFMPAGSSWNWFGKPVSALALIAFGFFGARVLPTTTDSLPASTEVLTMGLGDSSPIASRIRFIEPRDNGRVQIILEETRQRTLSGDMEDSGIRALLLRAARESTDPGVRVETMDLLKSQPQSEEIRRALLYAVRHDSNAGVRLKALEALRTSAGEPDTRTALAEVLLKDANPGVRTQVIDLLTLKPQPELVGVLQEIMTRENNTYVRMKCQRALADMNASVETF